MRLTSPRIPLLAMVLALFLVATGCPKKDTTTTPTPETPDSAEMQPEPEPEPEPVETQPTTRDVDDDFESEPIRDAQPTRDELKDELTEQLKSVYFEFNKEDLSDVTRRVLQDNARILKNNDSFDVVVEGHCDDRGTIEYNLALGQRRAAAVREYLVSLGISGSRLRTVSYGEERPAANGSGESVWSRNRRAEFVVE